MTAIRIFRESQDRQRHNAFRINRGTADARGGARQAAADTGMRSCTRRQRLRHAGALHWAPVRLWAVLKAKYAVVAAIWLAGIVGATTVASADVGDQASAEQAAVSDGCIKN